MSGIGRRWLRAAIYGTILMALGSTLIVGVHFQTRGDMRKVLEQTDSRVAKVESLFEERLEIKETSSRWAWANKL